MLGRISLPHLRLSCNTGGKSIITRFVMAESNDTDPVFDVPAKRIKLEEKVESDNDSAEKRIKLEEKVESHNDSAEKSIKLEEKVESENDSAAKGIKLEEKVESENDSAAKTLEEERPLSCPKARGGGELQGGCILPVIKGWFSQVQVKSNGSFLYL